jgi:hypothetical protein
MVMSKLLALSIAFVLFFAFAQETNAQSQPASTPASTSPDQALKPEQLDALVSPIALYPDTLLAEVLMASTYPLEVVQAARWVAENKNLKGDALKTEVDKQGWDESIKSLTATPDVLKMMSDKLDWTQKLGDAVLAQQTDVMDSIQRLRAKADANNKLQSTKQQKVTKKSDGGKQYIVIEPTDPETIYVPYYDPAVVYGAWPYPAYPPYYWGAGYWPGGGALLATGLAFGAGYAVGRWAGGGNYWGGGVGWGNNNINVNRPVNINNIGNNWNHNVDHRHGVRYNNKDVANKFNKGNNIRNGAQNRMDFRGRDGKQALRPGGDGRPGGGDRPGAGGASAWRGRPLAAASGQVRKAAASGEMGNRRRRKAAANRARSKRPRRSVAAVVAVAMPSPAGRTRRHGAGVTWSRQSRRTWRRRRHAYGRRWRWRLPRRWWRRRTRWWRRPGRRWRTTLGYRAQARHQRDRSPRQWPRILSLQLQRQRQGLCRRDGAGGADRQAGCGCARP